MDISGVENVQLQTREDARGALAVLDRHQGLPFDVKRLFYLFDCPTTSVRAEHAVSADMVLVAICGSVSVDCDNGQQQTSRVLAAPNQAIVVRKGVWVKLHTFQAGTVVLVASEQNYADVAYFDQPVTFHDCPPTSRAA